VRVCGFCHQPVAYTQRGTQGGCYVHSATGDFVCLDENGDQHDCNTRNIPVLQWEPPGTEVRHWWRRRKLVRRARKVERPAPGVRIIREEWDDRSADQWPH
jgi:hypothetical protein